MSRHAATPQRDRRRRRRAPRLLVLAAVSAFVFALGVSLGRALEEGPRDGPVATSVRTLDPLPLAPPASTVTVTVTTGS